MGRGLDEPLPRPEVDEDDEVDGRTLRPTTWDDYVGQDTLKRQLQTKCRAAFKLARPLDHLLIHGPMGSGKTTLARLAADETGDELAVIARRCDQKGLMEALWSLPGKRGVLFIDEAHRLPTGVQEDLLTLTEEGYIDSKWGVEEFPWLTVIMATTEKRLINEPLQTRCTILDMDDYSLAEMEEIVRGMARRAQIGLDDDIVAALAVAAVGVPRSARRLVLGAKELEADRQAVTVENILAHCRVEPDGLTNDHLGFLREMERLGGQAGLEVLSVRLQLHKTQVQRTERLLVDRGLVRYGPGGRLLTGDGRRRLDGPLPVRAA